MTSLTGDGWYDAELTFLAGPIRNQQTASEEKS